MLLAYISKCNMGRLDILPKVAAHEGEIGEEPTTAVFHVDALSVINVCHKIAGIYITCCVVLPSCIM